MQIRRLGWAGIEIEHGDESLVIDLVEDLSSMETYVGTPRRPLPPPRTAGAVETALATHLHADHTDPAALKAALTDQGKLYRPRRAEGEFLEIAAVDGAERALAELGIPSVEAEPWQSFEAGAFTVTAVPAVDGFGDPQVSWVVEAGGRRVIHCGDTIFHGSWWQIRMRLGPFDSAFMSVNGAIVSLPHRQPASTVEAVMNPEQAVLAAGILGARRLVPIHFDTIDGPPVYEQTDAIVERVRRAADATEGLDAVVLEEDETLNLDAAGAAA